MQKVMICTTYQPSLRSEIDGLSFEDGDTVSVAWRERRGTGHEYKAQENVPVGLVGGSLTRKHYPTVLHALGDGWRLIGPPQRVENLAYREAGTVVSWTWWLVKENVNET